MLFTQLCKYDGQKTKVLGVRNFQQISGRAGRRGYDVRGSVAAQAPAHVVENESLKRKAADDPKKLRKLVYKKPPERGYAHWDGATFERLVHGEPERLASRFQVSHSMLLHVLSRPGDGCIALKELIRSCHDGPSNKRRHRRIAFSLFRSLLNANVVELLREPDETGRRVRIHTDLQADFSLNQTLALYVVEAMAGLDPDHPEYALDVLTVVESVLEDPEILLSRQLDKCKRQKLAELKASGVEYGERVLELDKVDRPKPLEYFIEETFQDFSTRHPWVGSEAIKPKSVAREMFETASSFREYVKEYNLERAEGVLLRYLSEAYKAMVQTVPEALKSDEVHDLIEWLGVLVRQIDSSILDEWESMRDPDRFLKELGRPRDSDVESQDVTLDSHRFTVLIRNEVWRLMTYIARKDYEKAAAILGKPDDGPAWTAERLESTLADYWKEHSSIRLDPVARNPRNTMMETASDVWRVTQVIVDPEELNEWAIRLRVDLAKSKAESRPVLSIEALGADV